MFPNCRPQGVGWGEPEVRSELDQELGLYPVAKGSLWGYSGATGEGRVQQDPEPAALPPPVTPRPRGKGLLGRGRSPTLMRRGDRRGRQILPVMTKDTSTLGRKGVR